MNSGEVDPNSANTAQIDCIPLFTSASAVGRPGTEEARALHGPLPTDLYKMLLTFYSFTGQGDLTIFICFRHTYFRRTGGRVVARVIKDAAGCVV